MDPTPNPSPLDYAGRTPNAAGRIDDETKSLGEGCAAMAILVLVIPLVRLVLLCTLIGCAFVLFTVR